MQLGAQGRWTSSHGLLGINAVVLCIRVHALDFAGWTNLSRFVLCIESCQQVDGEHGEEGVYKQQRHASSDPCVSHGVWQSKHDLPNLQTDL